MNYLAHLLLSGPDPQLRAGAILGDFVRGTLQQRFPEGVEQGIRLHRFVDASSGRHPAMREALQLFPSPWRRWAPIGLDVLFDHYLARSFERWHDQPLARFSQECYRQLNAQIELMPTAAADMVRHMQRIDLLGRYRHRDSVARALAALSSRARSGNLLTDLPPRMEALDAPLLACFEHMFPDLQRSCGHWRRHSATSSVC